MNYKHTQLAFEHAKYIRYVCHNLSDLPEFTDAAANNGVGKLFPVNYSVCEENNYIHVEDIPTGILLY